MLPLWDHCDCKNCKTRFVFRLSTLESPDKDQNESGTESDPLVLACPTCRHVYDYSDQQPKSIPIPSTQPGTKTPTVFFEQLYCDEIGCYSHLRVVAPREPGTTATDFAEEKER